MYVFTELYVLLLLSFCSLLHKLKLDPGVLRDFKDTAYLGFIY